MWMCRPICTFVVSRCPCHKASSSTTQFIWSSFFQYLAQMFFFSLWYEMLKITLPYTKHNNTQFCQWHILRVKNFYSFHLNCHPCMFIWHSFVMTQLSGQTSQGKMQTQLKPSCSLQSEHGSHCLPFHPYILDTFMYGKTILIKFKGN